MTAVKILMKKDAIRSNNPKDLKGIGISDGKTCHIYAIADLYVYLREHSDVKIYVKDTNAYLVPTTATNGEKYIRTVSNSGTFDSLMNLPRMV